MGSAKSKMLDEERAESIVVSIKETFTPTGKYNEDKDRALAYAMAMRMDEQTMNHLRNDSVTKMANFQGFPVAAKSMVEEFTDPNGKLD
jgi:hypothetical protein